MNSPNLNKKERDLEDVEASIKHLSAAKNRRHRVLKIVLTVLFFPIAAIYYALKTITHKVRLTTKTTLIFTTIFGLLIVIYMSIILVVFRHFLAERGALDDDFMLTLLVLSIGLGLAFIFIGAAAGAIISNAMLSPIRKMIGELSTIDGDNLSLRLGAVDTQDEICELVEHINEMLDSLEEVFERQTNFVADASHELKTPLSVISGYSDLLLRWGREDAEILDEGITSIRRESQYMSKIIEKMLILARLGKLTMHKQEVDLSDTVIQIVEGYKVINPDRNISVYGDAEVVIECDKTLLTEAVRAIIDNAIKYTPKEGSVMVIVSGSEAGAEIKVRDTGVGIDESSLPFIFDRFYRCDKTRGREKGSAGLGLTICKNIIEMMDGNIIAKSTRGEGTEFTIKLKKTNF